ncbi:MAG TPA: S8 family serine peptidase [Anaerolineales bacterium]|nr:S8 family serine peptidase [Anaerolineales bacterium]
MKAKWFSLLIVFVMLAVAIVPTAGGADAKSDPKSYIVVMAGDPIVAYEGGEAGFAATKPGKNEKVNPNSANVKKYDQFLKGKQNASLAAANVDASAKVNEYTFGLNGYSAILTDAQVEAIRAQKDVLLVLEDQMRYLDTDSSGDFLGLTEAGGAYAKGYTGEGVVVGVIDSGIWPEHPSFADDGTFPPAPVLDNSRPTCEFGNSAHNPNDVPFTCNNKLVGARQMLDTYRFFIGATPDEFDSARDDNGHGTHTASTAAGNAGVEAVVFGLPRGTVSGIAPRAQIIAYKGLGDLGGFTSDLAASIDQAVADGVDVINYSIGGGASGPGADEIAFLFADAAGVFVATSAGNSGPGASTLGNPGTMPWLMTVGASTQSRFFQGTVVLGDGSEYVGASMTSGVGSAPLVDAEFAGGDLCIPGTLDPGLVAGKIVLCRRGAIARVGKSQAVLDAGGVGMIMYENTDDNSLFSDPHFVPSVHVDNTPGLAIKAYIASASSPTAELVTEQLGEWPNAPTMTYFSSRGPNPISPDIIKPDITAPGIHILAGNSPFAIGGVQGELFQAIAGTSMSSPHIAGVGALLKQAHPDWSPAMIKSAMMTTAYQDVKDNDRVSPADPFDMGAGHVNPGGQWIKGSVAEPGLAYDAGLFEYAAYTCGEEFGVFTPGSCVFLESIGVPTEAYNLNVPSIGAANVPGSLTVTRTVTSVANESGWRTYNATVEAPAGYTVSVSPSTFSLKSGMSATFEVTIANAGAPAGEWRFGSLTWNDDTGHYNVYSPIAVKAALFSAPVEVSGSGEAGSTSFDVSFGYTGDYTAAAHGLEPATVTSDVVVQDPDQTFNPNDGFSNLHQFNLSGAAYFRIAMPPESVTDPAIDLDIFVYDPNGVQVASSTSGATNELIDIALPMDGTWSVFVHGWQTAGPSAAYNMYSWVVSATPGGNMTIDSAPASALIGSTAAVDVSWTGATAGQWHLGAVSHSDGSLLGLTLVNVDNR